MKLWKRTVALMLITLLCSLIPVGVLSLYVTGKRSLNNAAETYGRQLANEKNLLEQFWDNSKYEQMSETGFAKMTDFDGTRPRSAYGKLTPDEEIAYYKARNLYLEMLIKLEKKKQFELEARRIMSQAPKTKKNGF